MNPSAESVATEAESISTKEKIKTVTLIFYVLLLMIATYSELAGKHWFDWLSLTQY